MTRNEAIDELLPIDTFDPAQGGVLYDSLNDEFFAWPEGARWNPQRHRKAVFNWDGLLLEGWLRYEDGLAFVSDISVSA